MATYLLTAVTPDGYGLTHHWGDAYEVEAESYEAAEADVLGRVGVSDQRPYDRIVKAWVKDGGSWTELPVPDSGAGQLTRAARPRADARALAARAPRLTND